MGLSPTKHRITPINCSHCLALSEAANHVAISIYFSCPRGGPRRAQGMLGTVGKINDPFENNYKNRRANNCEHCISTYEISSVDGRVEI